MSAQDRNNPLHGVGLDAMFSEILRHYHWEVLAEQLKFKCLENHPSFAAATKFLKKTKWAREKTEAFYLYRFKQLPIPTDEEHELPPRERSFADDVEQKDPAEIKLGDKEFFDDPISGPKFSSKTGFPEKRGSRRSQEPQRGGEPQRNKEPQRNRTPQRSDDFKKDTEVKAKPKRESNGDSSDPWAKWK